MTLILSCITADHAVQVSDRRLTWLSGPNEGTLKDDEQNKALVIRNHQAFAYTGIAEIENQKTDDWLFDVAASITSSTSVNQIYDEIAKRAGTAFGLISLGPSKKRHAFVGVCWARWRSEDPDAPLNSCLVSISNALDDRWQWQQVAGTKFDVRFLLRKSEPFLLKSAGQEIDLRDLEKINIRIRKAVERKLGPYVLIQVMAGAILKIADKNSTVGTSLMAISIPKAAVGTTTMLGTAIQFGTEIPDDKVIAIYLPGPNNPNGWYGPNYVGHSLSAKGFECKPSLSQD